MARECERREAARSVEVLRRERERPPQHALRLAVVGRVARLAGPLLVGEPEQVEAAHVVGPSPQAGLQLRDERDGVAGGEPGRQCRFGTRPGSDPGRVGARQAAQEEGGGGDRRRRRPDQEPPSHGFACTRFRPSHGEARNGNAAGSGLSLSVTESLAAA